MSSPIPPSSSLRLHLPRLAPSSSSSSPPSTTCHSLPTPPPTATFPTPSFICTDCDPSANPPAYHRRNLLLEHKALKHIQQFVTCDAEGKPLIINRSPFDGHFHCSLCKVYSSESALVCSLHIQHTCTFALGTGSFVLREGNEKGSPMVWERKIIGVQSKGSGDVSIKSTTTVRLPLHRRALSINHASLSSSSPSPSPSLALSPSASHPPPTHRKSHSIALPITSLLFSHPSPSPSPSTLSPSPSPFPQTANLVLENAELWLRNQALEAELQDSRASRDQLRAAQIEFVKRARETIDLVETMVETESRLGVGMQGMRLGVERVEKAEVEGDKEEQVGTTTVTATRSDQNATAPSPISIVEPAPAQLSLPSYRPSGIELLNPDSPSSFLSFGRPSIPLPQAQGKRTPSYYASSSAQFQLFSKKHPRSISTAEGDQVGVGKRIR